MKEGFKNAFDGFVEGWLQGCAEMIVANSIILTIGCGLYILNKTLINKKEEE